MNNTSLATVNTEALPSIPKPASSSQFVFQPQSYAEWMELCKMLSQSDIIPKSLQGKPGNVYIILQMGTRLGIDPGFMLQNVYVVNGRPAMFGDLPLSIVRASGRLEWIKEGYRGEEKSAKDIGEDFTAVCEVKRYGQEPITQTFSVADAREANLWGNAGPWKQYWKRMLKFRARGFALRDVFGDVLQGLACGEEERDAELKTVTETQPSVGGSRTESLLAKMQSAQLPAGKVAAPITFDQREAGEVLAETIKTAEAIGLEPLSLDVKIKDDQPDPEVTVSMVTTQAKRKGLNEDAFRILVQNSTGSTKLTKANIGKVIDAINALPLPMISDDDLEKFGHNVPPPDLRMLAVAANKCGMDLRDVMSLIGELALSTPLTAESYKIVLGEIDARVAAAV
jgi:hypothetical protein